MAPTPDKSPSIWLEDGASLTSIGARNLAALLTEAADELDGLGAKVLGL